MKNIAIITGATGGFGNCFVELLSQKSQIDEIWAIGRNQKKLDELKEKYNSKIKTFSFDLAQKSSLEQIKNLLEQNKNEITIKYLVNNAGYGKFASYEELDYLQSVNMIDLNVSSVVALCVICIPFMKENSRILNISSQSSYFPLPYLNIYSATKVFVKNYSRALNVELKEKKISCTAVCPGWMETSFIQNGETGAKKDITNFFGITTPLKVAKKALKDCEKGRDVSIYGLYNKLTHVLSKILPQKIMILFWRIQQKF